MEYETVYLDIDPLKPGTTRPEPSLAGAQSSHELIEMLASQGAAARAPQRIDEQMVERTAGQVSVSAPPLVLVSVGSLAAIPSAGVTGQATTVAMIAEQQTETLDAGRTQLVELFECSKW